MAETTGHRPRRGPSAFARRLLAEWERLALPSAGEPVVVAVSGGSDSTALLLALVELIEPKRLAVKLKIAHLDHGLRGRAGAEDARWVAQLSGELGLEVEIGRAPVARRAHASRDNLEQAARRERYEFLARAAREAGASVVLTAHTLDDQAETFLLALLRGGGADGLGGMRPVRALDAASPRVVLARPLLSWARRDETEGYCRERGVVWRADAMNEDERFARVRVRRRLLPLLETFNPRVREALARTAELLRADSAALDEAAARLLEEAADEAALSQLEGIADGGGGRVPPLRVEALAGAAEAIRRRALRLWLAGGRGDLRRLELRHVEAVERLLAGSRGGRVAELPGGCAVVRRRRWLFFRDCRAAGKN
ncbi:MAG TPA: tRNA lysidine(34) synthetase TilS [Pyrinomonadaceae bacterium]|nr:tRNA lysidine(34) synthetase TilS [Pyrinomonadaceae bacterium]